jgi:hypothetical protein
MATDFSYGWDSKITNRLYRIEAQSNVTADNDYTFTIDGIRFSDLPSKPVGNSGTRKSLTETSNNGRYGNEYRSSNETTAAKRGSATESGASHYHNDKPKSFNNGTSSSGSKSDSSNRPNFQSPATTTHSNTNKSRGGNSGGDFDPFAASGTNEPFDPFGNESNSSHGPSGNNRTPQSTQNNKLNKPTPSSANKPSSAAKSVFGSISEDSPAVKANNISFDAFGDNDAFNSGAGGGNTSVGNKSNSDYGFDAFGGNNSNASGQTKKSANTQPDFFSDSPAFSSQPAGSHNSSGAPARRASAVEISMDFAGLSFESKPDPQSQKQQQLQQQPRDVPKQLEEESPKSPEETIVDPWASNLVDLDLTGRAAATRRSSLQANSGPSLNQMLTGNQKRPSLGGNKDDPFGAPAILPVNQSVLSPAQPVPLPPMKPLTPALAISSLGPASGPPPMMMGGGGGYGAPGRYSGMQTGMPPQPAYMGNNTNSMMMNRGTMGASPVMGGNNNNTRGSFIGTIPNPAPTGYSAGYSGGNSGYSGYSVGQQPKSSLDTLDWKS